MYAMVDCNNFYVSCERVFNPSLIGKPVVVLSNNDGCAISRSDEAKAIGVVMGAIPHMNRALFEKHGVQMFSSNYTLYGDMSERVMKILASFVPQLELYSIDEAFLDMSAMRSTDLFMLGTKIKNAVEMGTGIPVCIGIAPTKALAKMANRFVKKRNKTLGVHWAATPESIEEMLVATDVGNVWGIGRQYALMLNRNNIRTAMDFVHAPEDFIRSKMHVTGVRLQKELKGISAIENGFDDSERKNICISKSFGSLTANRKAVLEALTNFAATCALKARTEKTAAKLIKVSLNTNPHRRQDRQYYASIKIKADTATSNTAEIIKYAQKGFDVIFKEGYSYMKCGVELRELQPDCCIQTNLFSPALNSQKLDIAIKALDKVNRSLGKETVRFAVQGFSKKFNARAAHLSPRYTTRLSDILKIRH